LEKEPIARGDPPPVDIMLTHSQSGVNGQHGFRAEVLSRAEKLTQRR